MVEKKTILLSEICREALATRAPGEDLDEALLRAAKKLYPEEGLNIFSTIQEVLKVREQAQGKPRNELVSAMAQGQDSFEMTQTTFGTTVKGGVNFKFGVNLSTMPPEMKSLVEEALAKGKAVSTTTSVQTQMVSTLNHGAQPPVPPAGSPPESLPSSPPLGAKPQESGMSKFMRWFKITFLGGPN
jgi:hypothetical protein